MKTFSQFREEVENLDELSKKTLANYTKKAADDYANKNAQLDRSSQDKRGVSGEKRKKVINKFLNRNQGIRRATDRLSKD